MKHFIYTVTLFLYSFFANAQQYYIRGQVKDESGAALQNVTILLHSTGYLYTSGTEGSFGIISRVLNDTLSFYKEGYVRQKLPVRTTDFVDIKLKKQVVTKNANVVKLSSLTENLKREVQQEWFIGEETYASLIENNFVAAADYPTTAITLNTDRASYSNIRRFINAQATVPPDAVRLDEMLNYFNFNYTPPPPGKDFDISATLTTCPWNKNNRLLFTQVNGRKIALDSLPPSHLVFLIDVSGSMDMPNRLPLLKSGFKALVNTLRSEDSVTIIVYGGAVGIALPITGGDEKDKIFKTIDSLQAGGSTPGESGIKIAYRMAKDHFLKNGNNRVILATDGDFNVGLRTEAELEQLITDQRNNGIYLTCLGIGMGNYKDSKIQALAQKGNGNFAYIDSYAEAEKILLKEFCQTLYTTADDASFTVQFNPEYVKEYRLIGFDNKVGAIRDSTSIIEGGEIGSAFSGLVVFEIEPKEADLRQESLALFTLKYKDPVTGIRKILEESPVINHTPFTQLSPCYQFASAVIMFGAVLRQSELIKTNWNEITTLAKASADRENFSQQEFLALIEQAKKIYTKRKKKVP